MTTFRKSAARLFAVMLMLVMVIALSACESKETEPEAEPQVEAELAETLSVAALNGPTGMGMVDLADNEKIELSTFQAPDEAVQKFVSGEIKIAAVPSNLAPVLYNKTNGNVVVLTTITSGILYITENGNEVKSLDDLRGKTIFASGKGGTPEYVLELLLTNAGLTPGEDVMIEWLEVHADVAQKLMQTEGGVALLPEPFVSTVTSKSENISIAVDMNEEWKKVYFNDLPMGVVIADKNTVSERPDDIAAFLTLLNMSVENVNEASDEVVKKIVDAGFLTDPEIAKQAIPRCNITYMQPEDNKNALKPFYESLFEIAPQAIGGTIPADDFYYTGK